MKIVAITSRIPWPLEKGDKLRAYHQLKALSRKHEIILFALQDRAIPEDAEKELKKFCSAVYFHKLSKAGIFFQLVRGFFSGIPLQAAYFRSSRAKRAFEKIVRQEKPDSIYFQLLRTAEYGRHITSGKKVLDYMDVFSKGVERRLPSLSFWVRPIFGMEKRRLLRYEKTIFSWFDACTIISEQDRNLIPHPDREKITVVPNGVDTGFFFPKEKKIQAELLFNGNMAYPPNVECAEYLVRKVMPLVHRQKPDIKLLISGATPSPRVLALQSDKVTVSGWVDDVRDSYSSARMLVAPMQSGIGLQNKILEAMAMGLPCITSSLCNNAVGAVNGKEIIVADTPEACAEKILYLLSHPEQAVIISEAALSFVRKQYDWDAMTEKLSAVFESQKPNS